MEVYTAPALRACCTLARPCPAHAPIHREVFAEALEAVGVLAGMLEVATAEIERLRAILADDTTPPPSPASPTETPCPCGDDGRPGHPIGRHCDSKPASPTGETRVLNCVHGRPGGAFCPHCVQPASAPDGAPGVETACGACGHFAHIGECRIWMSTRGRGAPSRTCACRGTGTTPTPSTETPTGGLEG
jgi:hypothetical protein